jgi:hypothetical protein
MTKYVTEDEITNRFRVGYRAGVKGDKKEVKELRDDQKEKHFVAGFEMGAKDYDMMNQIAVRYGLREVRIAKKYDEVVTDDDD